MKPREKRWAATALAVSGLFVIGGAGNAAYTATPLASAQPHLSHVAPDFPIDRKAMAPGMAHSTAPTAAQIAFRDQMRKLWEEHVTWTRLYIVSAAAGLPDEELTAQRLLSNQTDIGNAISAYYGEAAGAELTTLLQEHISGAADLLAAARTGDHAAIETASANWYANGYAIAAFLNAANPEQWPLADMQAEMKMHLDLTLREATARLHSDYAADITAYDDVENHILAFADLLSTGIMQQFPERFA
jgi:hypothetical protein